MFSHSSTGLLIIPQLVGALCVSENDTNPDLNFFCDKRFANVISRHLHHKPRGVRFGHRLADEQEEGWMVK